MSKKNGQKRRRIPENIKPQIVGELGTMPDEAIAIKYSELAGFEIPRQTIFYMRKSRKIPAFVDHEYTPPPFRGRLEDAHPEVEELLGKVPVIRIAERFGVSRSCVRAAAKRLGKDTRATDYSLVFEAVGSE